MDLVTNLLSLVKDSSDVEWEDLLGVRLSVNFLHWSVGASGGLIKVTDIHISLQEFFGSRGPFSESVNFAPWILYRRLAWCDLIFTFAQKSVG